MDVHYYRLQRHHRLMHRNGQTCHSDYRRNTIYTHYPRGASTPTLGPSHRPCPIGVLVELELVQAHPEVAQDGVALDEALAAIVDVNAAAHAVMNDIALANSRVALPAALCAGF